MGNDMIVALGQATVDGHTVFGLNNYARPQEEGRLRLVGGRAHALDETVPASHATVAQVRQTYTALGHQPRGAWGFMHGINEHQLALGVTNWYSRLPQSTGGLAGCDLVRLALERSRNALQAVEMLSDLLAHHGHCDGAGSDHVFLIADATEAFVLETAGQYWALMECRETRAVTDVALVRQDWRRLSPGLADFAIAQRWWLDDGSKLDFAGSLGSKAPSHALARRRWGRASVALAQQAGAIDSHFVRRMLTDYYEQNATLLPDPGAGLATTTVASLRGDGSPSLAWMSFGPAQLGLYFPLTTEGDLPSLFGPAHPENPSITQRSRQLVELMQAGRIDRAGLNATLERLQTLFEQDAEEFLRKGGEARRQGDHAGLRGLATAMMQRHADMFEKEWRRLNGNAEPQEPPDWADAEAVPFMS